MHKKASIFGIVSLLTTPTMAANTVVIEQVGPGSVTVKQSGSENSVEVRSRVEVNQPIDKDKFDEKTEVKKSKKPIRAATDYQKEVINDPVITQRGRGQAVIEANKPSVSGINIYQQGDNNKAVTSQENDDNLLILQQEGARNEYSRTQKGVRNRARVKQNGKIIEDIEENNEDK